MSGHSDRTDTARRVTPTRIVRGLAGVSMGVTYAVLGLDAARSPGPRVGMAASTLGTIRKVVPLPADDEQIVRANGALQAAAGIALAATSLVPGRFHRWAALAVIGSLIPTTVAGHDFWNIDDPMARRMQRTQFWKNMAMLGGLLFAISDDRT